MTMTIGAWMHVDGKSIFHISFYVFHAKVFNIMLCMFWFIEQ